MKNKTMTGIPFTTIGYIHGASIAVTRISFSSDHHAQERPPPPWREPRMAFD